MTNLFIIPKLFTKRMKIFLDEKEVSKIIGNKPLQIKIKKPKLVLVNIKEGLTKNHYFYLSLKTDKILFLKKKWDVFGTRLVISQEKEFKKIINWQKEKRNLNR